MTAQKKKTDSSKTTVIPALQVKRPSDYKVEWMGHRLVGYRWRVIRATEDEEMGMMGDVGSIVVPNQIGGLTEHIPAWNWAFTEEGAKLKGARAIERLCTPVVETKTLNGEDAVRHLNAHDRANFG